MTTLIKNKIMKFSVLISLLGGTCSTILTIINLLDGKSHIASIWGTAACWAFANLFLELNLNRKEKQIQNIKDAILTSKDEVEAINKINEIL